MWWCSGWARRWGWNGIGLGRAWVRGGGRGGARAGVGAWRGAYKGGGRQRTKIVPRVVDLGGGDDVARPAGSDARTPREPASCVRFVPLPRCRCVLSGGRAAGWWDRSVRCARLLREAPDTMTAREGHISDSFTWVTAQSRARKTRLGCSTAGGWETTRTPETTPPLGCFPPTRFPIRDIVGARHPLWSAKLAPARIRTQSMNRRQPISPPAIPPPGSRPHPGESAPTRRIGASRFSKGIGASRFPTNSSAKPRCSSRRPR
jgi:hypothetical protein